MFDYNTNTQEWPGGGEDYQELTVRRSCRADAILLSEGGSARPCLCCLTEFHLAAEAEATREEPRTAQTGRPSIQNRNQP
jgi:hypothetical protein